MKGPGHRLKFDVRRVWECPVCHRRQKSDGRVVHLRCHCMDNCHPPQEIWMKLIEERLPGKQINVPREATEKPGDSLSPSPTQFGEGIS